MWFEIFCFFQKYDGFIGYMLEDKLVVCGLVCFQVGCQGFVFGFFFGN